MHCVLKVKSTVHQDELES